MGDLPNIERLREALEYNPTTGLLTFKSRADARPCWNARHVGKAAINTASVDGYRRGYLFGKMMLAHRVAFALHYGRTDLKFIDHINGDRSDNRAENLREVTRAENARNKARPSNSTTGHIGVSKTYDGRFRAHITVGNKVRHLGRFPTIEQAVAVRASAERELGFHQNHGRDLTIKGNAA